MRAIHARTYVRENARSCGGDNLRWGYSPVGIFSGGDNLRVGIISGGDIGGIPLESIREHYRVL